MALNPALLKMVSQAKSKYAGNAGKAIKPKEGRNTYRLLAPTFEQAPWVGANGQWWADLGVHWIKASEEGKPLAVVGDCDTVYQQPSILNTAIEMAIASAPDETSKELYESWKSRKTVLVNIVDRSDDSEQVLELTSTTFGKVLDLYQIYAQAGKDITDPLDGVDLIITRTGKGLNTNYDVAVAPTSAPLAADRINKATDLQDFIARNFFRGEETKALNAIAQIAGVAVPRLGGPVQSRTPTAALAAPSAAVAGASVAAAPAPVAAAPVVTAPAVDPAVAAAAAKRAELIEAQRKMQAELAALDAAPAAAPVAAAPAPAPVQAAPAAAPISALPASEQDAILAELDNLIAG